MPTTYPYIPAASAAGVATATGISVSQSSTQFTCVPGTASGTRTVTARPARRAPVVRAEPESVYVAPVNPNRIVWLSVKDRNQVIKVMDGGKYETG